MFRAYDVYYARLTRSRLCKQLKVDGALGVCRDDPEFLREMKK